jgi:beta-phosphoglucomutase-like phosphatase (HAD superfamily)
MMSSNSPTLHLDRVDAVLVDADSVVVDTARLHGGAWQKVFDDFLQRHNEHTGLEIPSFDMTADYWRYADGRPGTEAVRSFLTARGITLRETSADRHADTVQSLAARKNARFLEELRQWGVRTFASAVTLLRNLKERGVRTAALSTSRNCAQVLACAHVAGAFDIRVDGIDAALAGLPACPDPGMLLEATHRLGVSPRRSAVMTTAPLMVEAAWNGCFEPIIGVDRRDERSELYRLGAHVVVNDLDELTVSGRRQHQVLAHR